MGRPKPYTGMVKVERDRKFKVTYVTLPERWDHPRNRKLIENYIPWGDLSPVEKVFIQDCHCLGRPKPYTGMAKVERDRKFKVTYVTLMVRTDGKDQQGRK